LTFRAIRGIKKEAKEVFCMNSEWLSLNVVLCMFALKSVLIMALMTWLSRRVDREDPDFFLLWTIGLIYAVGASILLLVTPSVISALTPESIIPAPLSEAILYPLTQFLFLVMGISNFIFAIWWIHKVVPTKKKVLGAIPIS